MHAKAFTKNYTSTNAIAGQLLYDRIFCSIIVTRKNWANLFEEEPYMIEIETGHYIKGMHNLMSSLFDLGIHQKLKETLHRFKLFSESKMVDQNVNNRIQCFVYL
ncbi:MAG: hypothetical protein WDM71_00705 [Ferruginibacter sp.]